MLKGGIEALRQVLLANVAVDAVYAPLGGGRTSIKAVTGRTTFRATDESGVWTRYELRDFIVAASQLGLEPKVGDEIEWNGARYEVLAQAGEPAWRWSDSYKTAMRIHTKRIGGS